MADIIEEEMEKGRSQAFSIVLAPTELARRAIDAGLCQFFWHSDIQVSR